MRQIGALTQTRVLGRIAQYEAAAHANAMKPGQQAEEENQAQAHVLGDIRSPALADPFDIGKNDETDASNSCNEDSDSFKNGLLAAWRSLQRDAAVAFRCDRRIDVFETRHCRIENNLDGLRRIISFDRADPG